MVPDHPTAPSSHAATQGGAQGAAKPLVELREVSKQFPVRQGLLQRTVGQVQAVNRVSLSIYPGETVGLVGESGCGKSTLGRCILQLIRPNHGQVLLEGQDLTKMNNRALRPLRKKMQLVFQNPYSSLDPRMSIGDTLAEPLQIHRVAKGPALRQRIDQLLDRVGLPKEAVNRYPHEFSGGQRQRVGIARALALNPEFIVADEPVSALDVSIQAQILNLLQDLQQEFKLTYLFIAHNLSVVEYISNRVVVMYLGQIVEIAPVERLYQQPLHPYTMALVSAIPLADPVAGRARSQKLLLEGDPPNPANPPSGCCFHTRCPYVVDACRTETPEPTEYAPGHVVACSRIAEIHSSPGGGAPLPAPTDPFPPTQ